MPQQSPPVQCCNMLRSSSLSEALAFPTGVMLISDCEAACSCTTLVERHPPHFLRALLTSSSSERHTPSSCDRYFWGCFPPQSATVLCLFSSVSFLTFLTLRPAAIECHRRPNAETGLELDHSHLSRSNDLTLALFAQVLGMELLRSSATRCRRCPAFGAL